MKTHQKKKSQNHAENLHILYILFQIFDVNENDKPTEGGNLS